MRFPFLPSSWYALLHKVRKEGAMALSECPACGGTVSEEAATCPHCGHPIQGTSTGASGQEVNRRKGAATAFKVIGTLLVLTGMVGCMAQQEAGSEPMVSGTATLAGFVAFIVGRFMDSG